MPSPISASFGAKTTLRALILCGVLMQTTPFVHADDGIVLGADAQSAQALHQNTSNQDKALLDAARSGDLTALQTALAAGATVDFADKSGTTALMLAAQSGKSELVSVLLEKGANPNLQNKDGRTALHLATQIGAPKKKKFSLGKIAKVAGNVLPMLPGGALLGAMSGQMDAMGALGNLASLGSALGGKHSATGNSPDGGVKGGFDLSNKSGWTAVISTALQGDAKLGGSLNLESFLSSDFKTLRATDWINLMSGVQGANPQVITAISNLAGDDTDKTELWSQFVTMASTGDRRGVIRALSDPQMQPLLQQATSTLAAATNELPGNAGRHIVTALLAKGANASLADESQQTAGQLAQARGWTQIAAQLGVSSNSNPASNER